VALNNHESRVKSPTILGLVGVTCALLGLLAWIEYGAFATRGIFAAASGQRKVAHRMASYADGFRCVQLLLGVLSIGMGWTARTRREASRLARASGFAAICLGVVVLALLMLLV